MNAPSVPWLWAAVLSVVSSAIAAQPPNVVVILTDDQGYLTNRLTEEAVGFIDRNKAKPFFLYLAYNAVHAPPQAPEADIEEFRKRFPGLSEKRAILMAMLRHLDDGVGEAVRTARWRFAAWPDGEELYDLRTDPAEHRNLADSANHFETLEVMRAHLRRVESKAVAAKR